MRAKSTSTPPSATPQNELQKSNERAFGSGEDARAYLERDVVDGCRRADMVVVKVVKDVSVAVKAWLRARSACGSVRYYSAVAPPRERPPPLVLDRKLWRPQGFLIVSRSQHRTTSRC